MSRNSLIETIEAVLPQTQCGLCSYKGCRPYAEAIATQREKIDRCLPGGTTVLQKLGALTQQNVTHLLPEMAQKQKPPMRALIREEECIGCTKCIQACPVDAILGAAKKMHTVIADECTGCELCVAPCPVDCIEMMIVEAADEATQQAKAHHAKQRYKARNQRLAAQPQEVKIETYPSFNLEQRQAEIQAAIARARNKRSANPGY